LDGYRVDRRDMQVTDSSQHAREVCTRHL
jgi:hypothetical protein